LLRKPYPADERWDETLNGIGMANTYNIFISHSWGYGNAYDTLVGFLNNRRYFLWKDYSVPKDDPIHRVKTKILLRSALRRHIALASCIIIPAGVYCSYSGWIEEEIEMAQEMNKPIIGVRPWGAERISNLVQENADVIVGWNSESVVNAVRNYSI
jgi:hypothetical protein